MNTCYQPLSRGTVRLASNRIYDQPEIDPNYLENQADIDCIIRAIRLSVKLIETDAFQEVNAKIHWPRFSQCNNFFSADEEVNATDQYLECIIRVGAVTAHHPGGTVSVGKSPNSALDSRMRVRGVRKLRVVDASIIPSEYATDCRFNFNDYFDTCSNKTKILFSIFAAPVSGTPHTAIAAIAEWASQIILHKL